MKKILEILKFIMNCLAIFCALFGFYIGIIDIHNIPQLDKAIDILMVGFLCSIAAFAIAKIQELESL